MPATHQCLVIGFFFAPVGEEWSQVHKQCQHSSQQHFLLASTAGREYFCYCYCCKRTMIWVCTTKQTGCFCCCCCGETMFWGCATKQAECFFFFFLGAVAKNGQCFGFTQNKTKFLLQNRVFGCKTRFFYQAGGGML